MMFQIAMWSSYFAEMTPEEAIGLLAVHHCRNIELSEDHAAALLDRGNPTKTGNELRNFAAECGLFFEQGHLSLTADIAHPDHGESVKVVNDLKRWLDLFAGLGIKTAILHPGGVTATAAGWTEERIGKARGESLRMLAAYARGNRISLCLENVCQDADLLLNMIRDVGTDNLAVCLNTSTLAANEGNIPEFILQCNGFLRSVHAADNTVDRTAVFPQANGLVKWAETIKALQEINYQGLFSFEVPGERRLPLDVRLARLDQALAWAAEMLPRQA